MISKYTSPLKNMQLLTGYIEYILDLYKYHSDFSNSLNEIYIYIKRKTGDPIGSPVFRFIYIYISFKLFEKSL